MNVIIYKTEKDRNTFLERMETGWVKSEDDFHETILRSVENARFQNIKGFGAAFTESAGYALQGLDEIKQKEVMKLFFDKKEGNAYHFCRTHISSCDFSLDNYDYIEEDDTELKSFTIERDRKYILPMMKLARKLSGEDFRLLSSPWSPPGWMKNNGDKNHGGKLMPDYYKSWARHYVRYFKAMKDEGFPIWGFTLQNEPEAVQSWDSCVYTPEEARDFIKNELGPKLEKAGLSHIKCYIHDHNRDRLFERSRVILDDPDASKYINGAAIHWYCGDNYQNLEAFKTCYPDKDLIFSEGTQEEGNHHGSWKLGERYAYSIINDLNRGVSGWIDWNLVLDASGGPNHVYNLCSAPILIDRERNKYLIENSYYYIAHFSRFIKPGAIRILTTTTNDNLSILGAQNPDGSKVAVILNRCEQKIPFSFKDGDNMIKEIMAPRSIMTLIY